MGKRSRRRRLARTKCIQCNKSENFGDFPGKCCSAKCNKLRREVLRKRKAAKMLNADKGPSSKSTEKAPTKPAAATTKPPEADVMESASDVVETVQLKDDAQEHRESEERARQEREAASQKVREEKARVQRVEAERAQREAEDKARAEETARKACEQRQREEKAKLEQVAAAQRAQQEMQKELEQQKATLKTEESTPEVASPPKPRQRKRRTRRGTVSSRVSNWQNAKVEEIPCRGTANKYSQDNYKKCKNGQTVKPTALNHRCYKCRPKYETALGKGNDWDKGMTWSLNSTSGWKEPVKSRRRRMLLSRQIRMRARARMQARARANAW